MYESHTMPFQRLYHKGSKYYKVQIPELYGSNSKITKFKLILEMKFRSSATNACADPLNMDIREVQTNITTSKSGFETSQLLQRGQPLRSQVGLSNWTNTTVDDVERYLVINLNIKQCVFQCFNRTGVVTLEDEVERRSFLKY